ncbi:MAG: ParB/RepB/Spo0J family partition protein [Calditrichaeota bacterium]|nr:MAG: ParB/RepB/Spo0J family partition protein [Calditrichota bacterium]
MKNRQHLGKGLHALIPSAVTTDEIPSEAIQEIDVALIEPNPFQPRINFDEDSLEELKQSIKEKGVIQPILVRPLEDGRYQLVAGERRLRAVISLGMRQIPAFIREVTTDEEMLEIALIENVQREHLNPIDLAKGYQRLIDECGLTQDEVAKKIGKNRATVANIIRLLKLPEKIQESLRNGEIREGHARALLGVDDPKIQEKIWKKAVKDSLSVRSVEQLVRKAMQKEKEEPARPTRKRKPHYVTRAENVLREKLGTQVRVRTRKGGGTIEITFYSPEDLGRLMEIFDQIKF